MSTKIFYNDNRIIIDGHADTPQECQAITAMCDEMANSEKFKTIVYEKGHAVFERIGGERAMFLAGIPDEKTIKGWIAESIEELRTELPYTYLTQSDAASIYATKTLLNDAINELKYAIGSIDPSTQGTIAQQIGTINDTVENLKFTVDNFAPEVWDEIEKLANKASKPLPYTADELIAKLESI